MDDLKGDRSMRNDAIRKRRFRILAIALAGSSVALVMGITLAVLGHGRKWHPDDRPLPPSVLRSQADKSTLLANNKARLSIEDPRPLSEAIHMLEAKYGLVITYEDPRYTHPSEIVDVTEKVRRNLNKFELAKAPRVFVPKGGQLSFEYDDALARTGYQAALVQQLIDANLAIGNAGRFRVEQQGAVVHVIPIASKNERGQVVPQASVLDAVISLPKAQRGGLETLEAICVAISQVTRTRVALGSAPLSLFIRYRNDEGITRRPARDALAEFFAKVQNEAPLSWRLFYSPTLKMYVLNVHEVSTAHE
jgi:hypothetical protein